jgi:hypothetical protein
VGSWRNEGIESERGSLLVQPEPLNPCRDIGMSTLRIARQNNASVTGEAMAESRHEPGVTVVIPCLNERITIAEAVMQAQTAFANWPKGTVVKTDLDGLVLARVGSRIALVVEDSRSTCARQGLISATGVGQYFTAKVDLPASRDSAECLGPLPDSASRFPDTCGCPAPRGHPDGVHADSSSLCAPLAPRA